MSDQIIVLSDRTKELSRTTGTGPLTLDGAVTGFSAFGDFYASGDAVFYAVTDGTDYEVGSGQYLPDGSTNSLTRFPFRSTNSNNTVSFADGIKEVYVTYPGKYSVFTGSGLGPFQQPKASGIAFWESSQILNYDSNIVWNASGNNLGIYQTNPQHAIDIGGPKSYSQIRASGFLDGGSGILFSGVAGSYSGGRQLEPFLRNKVNNTTGTDAVIALSGLVDESILFVKQPRGMVFAGPPSGCGGPLGCADNYPTFRFLTSGDLPDLQYISQYNDANPNTDGAIALYKESGVAKYDNLFFYKDSTSTLALNTANPQTGTTSEDMSHIGPGVASSYPTVLDAHGSVYISGKMEQYGSFINYKKIRTPELEVISSAEGATPTITTYNLVVTNDLDVQGQNTLKFVSTSGTSGVMSHLRFRQADGTETIRIGEQAGSGVGNQSTAIGSFAGSGASGNLQTNMIGFEAGAKASSSNYSNIFGVNAGYEATGVSYSNLIGSGAGTRSSGNYNTYIGANAGYHTSGNNNIEIVTSGSYPSILQSGEPTHNKLNIGSTLVGDTSSKRIAIGFVSGVDLNPDSTLQILPSAVTDVGLSVRNVVGSTANSFEVVSGDKTTVLVSIDPTGSISTSGMISASGGLFLPQLVPNSTANKLYNDGGTLKFGGSTIEVGGSYQFGLAGDAQVSGVISDNQTITISGASGVVTEFMPATRNLVVNASGLSGVLDSQIGTVSGYLDSKIGGLPGGYGHWKASDGTVAGDSVASTETVSFSGVSGVKTNWNSTLNRLEINPSGLSGVLQLQIDALNAGAATVTAGSGLTMVGTQMNMDVNGSGQLEHLIFNDNQIRIGTGAGDSFDLGDAGTYWTAIGYQAGYGASGNDYTNMIGYGAGLNGSGNDTSVMIGKSAGASSTGCSQTNFMGFNAGKGAIGCSESDMIGQSAGYLSSGCPYSTMVGYWAGISAKNNSTSVMIGYQAAATSINSSKTVMIGGSAGSASSGISYTNAIGWRAGISATGSNYSNFMGNGAGSELYGCNHVNIFGSEAGSYLLNTHQANIVGHYAGAYASGNDSNNMIGTDAGYKSSGCANSNMIGSGAGMHTWNAPYSNILGAIAGSGANESSYINAIGNYAVSNITECSYLDVLGRSSAAEASGVTNGVILGSLAGYDLQNSAGVSIIGNQAGRAASGCTDSIMIGSAAGSYTSGCLYSNMIGTYAGFKTYDSDQSTMIGGYAGFEASNSKNSIMLGHYAGHNANNSSYSTYVGYYAGKNRTADSNLIIKTSTTTSNGGASWAGLDKDDVFDIAGMFNGVSEDTGDNPTTRQLRIGVPPDAVSDLSNICTSIKPKNASDVVLKLVPAASQTAAVMQTSRLSDGTAHEIINKDGYLRFPVAYFSDSADLYDAGGVAEANKIPKTEGSVCVASLAGDTFLAVVVGGTWYTTTDMTALHSR